MIAAIAAPFFLDFWDTDKGLSTFSIVVGAVVIGLSLVTDDEWGTDRQIADLDHGAARRERADRRPHARV